MGVDIDRKKQITATESQSTKFDKDASWKNTRKKI
jgi:hypothetical protein